LDIDLSPRYSVREMVRLGAPAASLHLLTMLMVLRHPTLSNRTPNAELIYHKYLHNDLDGGFHTKRANQRWTWYQARCGTW